MKLLLWLAASLVVLQGYIAVTTIPEFHVSDDAEFRKQIKEIGSSNKNTDAIRKLSLEEHWNARYGSDLASYTLALDSAVLLILGIAIVKAHRARAGTLK